MVFRAAERLHPYGQTEVAEFNRNGTGVPVNCEKAFEWHTMVGHGGYY